MKRLLPALNQHMRVDVFAATLLAIAAPIMIYLSGIAFHQRYFRDSLTNFLIALAYLALATLHWALLAYRQGQRARDPPPKPPRPQ